jgi:hypothetical protein
MPDGMDEQTGSGIVLRPVIRAECCASMLLQRRSYSRELKRGKVYADTFLLF